MKKPFSKKYKRYNKEMDTKEDYLKNTNSQ